MILHLMIYLKCIEKIKIKHLYNQYIKIKISKNKMNIYIIDMLSLIIFE